MGYIKLKTRFNDLVRIDKRQKKWLKKNKECKTIAGYLDIVINHYKKCDKNRNRKQKRLAEKSASPDVMKPKYNDNEENFRSPEIQNQP